MTHPSIDKHVKRIQSQLSRLGIRVTKDQVREVYREVVGDFANPTDEERAIVVEKLSQTPEVSGELMTVEPEPETIPTPQTFDIPVEDLPCLQPPEAETESKAIAPAPASLTVPSNAQTTGGITQAEVTQAIAQAVAQVGANSNAEAIELLTSLANELSEDISSVQEMTSALITAYLGKRQTVLASAIGTINTLRSAQTESFQAGLNQDFFDQKHRSKRQFLTTISGMFS